MSAPHRDLPAGSQRWADEMDAKTDKIAWLESVVRRLAQNAGVDPSNPDGLVNPQSGAPSSTSPVVQKLSSLDDVSSYNVADQQVLTWSHANQSWTPQTLPTDGDFQPDGSVCGFSPASQSTEAHGTGALETMSSANPYAWWGWTSAGHLDAESNDRTYLNRMEFAGENIYIGASTVSNEDAVFVRLDTAALQVQMNAASIGIPMCLTSTRPTTFNTSFAAIVYDSTTKQVLVNDGSGWNPVGGGGVGTDEFAVPSGTAFSLSGTDPQAEGHNNGASGQYGFTSTSDREVYLAATDGANGDANVYMSSAGVNIEADAPGTSSDYDMYSEALVAKDGITLKSTVGSGTGSGGVVKVLANWFIVPVQGHTLVSAAGKQGAMILDPGLNKPLWSDGTNWRDATGTVVS